MQRAAQHLARIVEREDASKMLRCALHNRLSTFCDFLDGFYVKSFTQLANSYLILARY